MQGDGKTLRLHVEAEAELRISVSFYREHGGEALASRFKAAVSGAFAAIADDPGRFPEVGELQGVRRARLRHFPFSVLYVSQADQVWVVAVAHGSRKPGYWARRLQRPAGLRRAPL